MNIGIISLYKNSSNFGGLLQAYALIKILEEEGYKAKQILQGEQNRNYKKRTIFDKIKKRGFAFAVEVLKDKIADKINKSEITQEDLEATLKECKDFRDGIPHTEMIDEDDLAKLNCIFDAFIVGSDQVWNSKWLKDIYFLPFSSKPKISYAASIARFDFSKYELQKLISGLLGFKWISVREAKAVTFLENNCKIKADLVLDPTMLLGIEAWSQVEKKPEELGNTEDFIFCYFLKGNKYKRKVANKFSSNSGYTAVFPNFTDNKIKYGNISAKEKFLYDVGPREFLWLIHHAKVVLTDSFHGTALSIVYNKQFYHILRTSNGRGDMNSRIYSLLSMFGLEKQMFVEKGRESIIDYSIVNRKLDEMRSYSLTLLMTNLKDIKA